jgi:hypothetical protein
VIFCTAFDGLSSSFLIRLSTRYVAREGLGTQSCSLFYSFSLIREVGRLEPGLSSMLLRFLPSWAVEGLEQVGLDSWNPRFRCGFTSFLVEVIGVDNVQGWVLDVRMMITSASPLSLNNPYIRRCP